MNITDLSKLRDDPRIYGMEQGGLRAQGEDTFWGKLKRYIVKWFCCRYHDDQAKYAKERLAEVLTRAEGSELTSEAMRKVFGADWEQDDIVPVTGRNIYRVLQSAADKRIEYSTQNESTLEAVLADLDHAPEFREIDPEHRPAIKDRFIDSVRWHPGFYRQVIEQADIERLFSQTIESYKEDANRAFELENPGFYSIAKELEIDGIYGESTLEKIQNEITDRTKRGERILSEVKNVILANNAKTKGELDEGRQYLKIQVDILEEIKLGANEAIAEEINKRIKDFGETIKDVTESIADLDAYEQDVDAGEDAFKDKLTTWVANTVGFTRTIRSWTANPPFQMDEVNIKLQDTTNMFPKIKETLKELLGCKQKFDQEHTPIIKHLITELEHLLKTLDLNKKIATEARSVSYLKNVIYDKFIHAQCGLEALKKTRDQLAEKNSKLPPEEVRELLKPIEELIKQQQIKIDGLISDYYTTTKEKAAEKEEEAGKEEAAESKSIEEISGHYATKNEKIADWDSIEEVRDGLKKERAHINERLAKDRMAPIGQELFEQAIVGARSHIIQKRRPDERTIVHGGLTATSETNYAQNLYKGPYGSKYTSHVAKLINDVYWDANLSVLTKDSVLKASRTQNESKDFLDVKSFLKGLKHSGLKHSDLRYSRLRPRGDTLVNMLCYDEFVDDERKAKLLISTSMWTDDDIRRLSLNYLDDGETVPINYDFGDFSLISPPPLESLIACPDPGTRQNMLNNHRQAQLKHLEILNGLGEGQKEVRIPFVNGENHDREIPVYVSACSVAVPALLTNEALELDSVANNQIKEDLKNYTEELWKELEANNRIALKHLVGDIGNPEKGLKGSARGTAVGGMIGKIVDNLNSLISANESTMKMMSARQLYNETIRLRDLRHNLQEAVDIVRDLYCSGRYRTSDAGRCQFILAVMYINMLAKMARTNFLGPRDDKDRNTGFGSSQGSLGDQGRANHFNAMLKYMAMSPDFAFKLLRFNPDKQANLEPSEQPSMLEPLPPKNGANLLAASMLYTGDLTSQQMRDLFLGTKNFEQLLEVLKQQNPEAHALLQALPDPINAAGLPSPPTGEQQRPA